MCELLDKYENRGIERGKECVNDLIRHLIGDGRIDEIERAVFDMEYQNKLFAEYGI